MKTIWLLFAAAIVFCACNEPKHPHISARAMEHRMDSLRADLLSTDLAFSNLSEESGRNDAFMHYADSAVVVLRAWSKPVAGMNNLEKLFSNHADTGVTLTWVPITADVSRSGDLGYTYGTYSLDHKNGVVHSGTYCTIWKKNRNKEWKFLLGTGNDGLRQEDME